MRTSVISRSVALAAATLGLALALPLTLGSTAAFACGDDAPAPSAPAEVHRTDPVTAFLPDSASTITAGGEAVELGVEEVNFTGSAYQHLAPGFAVFGSAEAGGNKLVNLQPEQLTVQVMADGAWRRLPVRHSCDPTLVADTSSLAAPLADNHAHRYLFRIQLAASVSAKIKRIDVYSGSTAQNKPNQRTLTVIHPTAPKPAPPKPAPSLSPAPAAVPAALVTTSAPAAAPAPAAELASTGPSSATPVLLGAGGACLLVGGGALYAVRRRNGLR